jgi:hypothetical protein
LPSDEPEDADDLMAPNQEDDEEEEDNDPNQDAYEVSLLF